MALDLKNLSPGDVLAYWYDTGSFGASTCYARVLKVGKKMIRVRSEFGDEVWRYPWYFHCKLTDAQYERLKDRIKWE